MSHQVEPYDEVDTMTVTRRYRRPPGGWWWGGLVGVPLVLALLGQLGNGDDTVAAPVPTTTATVTATPTDTMTTSPTDGATTASGTATTTPGDGTTSTDGSATATDTPGATASTATQTVTVTPTAAINPAAIGCGTFTKDVAGVLATNKITFSTGGAQLTGTSRQTIAAVASALKRCETTGVVVTGYTDNVGNEAANRALSSARAAAVRSALVANGVSSSRIASVGAGSSRPLASNDTDSGRAQNRRVEIVAN